MKGLHEHGRCVGKEWLEYVHRAREACNEYCVAAARLFSALEAATSPMEGGGALHSEAPHGDGTLLGGETLQGGGRCESASSPDQLSCSEEEGAQQPQQQQQQQQQLPWAHFVSAPWWHLMGSEVSAATKARAKEFTKQQFTLLSKVLPRVASSGVLSAESLSVTMGMLRMNVLGAQAFEDKRGAFSLFPFQSRTNHSCQPSARMLVYDDVDGEVSFAGMAVMRATRLVEKGEELTIDYLDGEPQSPGKRAHLLEQYQFNCQCALCSSYSLSEAAENERDVAGTHEE
jgi:hypothetical protein